MSVQLAVFDLAGTTVLDPGGVNGAFRGAMAQVGVDLGPSTVDTVMGLPKPQAIRMLLEQAGRAALLSQVDAIHAEFVRRMIRYYREDSNVGEVPGTSAVLARLKRAGVMVGVDTGFSRDIANVLLQRLGWEARGLVQASVTSDEVARGRPFPDMIHALMGRLGITDPRRVAKIGDTPSDLGEGTSAGCAWVVGVTYGTHTRAQLALQPHTHLVDDIMEVVEVLGVES